ncbi:MAG TPA: hypothetical protein VNU72_06685, partial [Puia sp.]|nr:hypothetical protein [Puia sp.]
PLKQAADGISLMAFFTFFWVFLAEIALEGRDRWLLGVLFGVVLLLLLAQYFKFNAAAKKLPADTSGGEEDPAKKNEGRRFLVIFLLTGVAIVVIKNVLANTGLDAYFIPCFALIVGLHFFPLARLFKQTFYYYIGIYMTLVALAGIGLTYQGAIWPAWLITAGVGIACALGTSLNGVRIVIRANRLIQDDNIAIN